MIDCPRGTLTGIPEIQRFFEVFTIWFVTSVLGQPLNCILQPHPKIMAEHQVIVGSHKEISLERRRRMGEYASSY